jgi:ectoine hydroxylase-related dioxygenase (phytanoyl-CoA dioxygenase family)
MSRYQANGVPIGPEFVGMFKDSMSLRGKPGALAERLDEQGYVYLRGVLPTETIEAARREVLHRLAEVGEVADPVEAGRWSGTSRRTESVADVGEWWRSVAEGPALRAVSHGPALGAVAGEILQAEPLGQDFLYLRTGVRGTATDLHYDFPFFARATERVVTCWVPLAEVPVELGPIAIIEGSNRFDDLVGEIKAIDLIAEPGRRAAFDVPVAEFAREHHARVLTTDFSPGDVLVLSMVACHGSLDNHDVEDRIRLSFDVRYQDAGAPRDERFYGRPPAGVTGRNYAELNGARPLGQKWHQR